MGRVFKQLNFGSSDELVTIPITEGGVKGKLSVFARLTGTGGSATLRVYGSFESAPTVLAGGGSSAHEVQTLDFGTLITNDFWLGARDISELGTTANPEFVGQMFDDTAIQITGWRTTKTETFIPANSGAASPEGPGIDENDFYTQVRTTTAIAAQVIQNNPYSAYVPPQTFTLTFNGHTTALVIASADMSADIQAALIGLVDFVPGDLTVAKVSATVYTVTFSGAYANQDVGPLTITGQAGFTATGVTESTKGATESEDITDTAALTNAVLQVVGNQENTFPYLTFVFGGDADPGLSAEAYVVAY